MTDVLGRRTAGGPAARLGSYLARDGSAGAPVALDLDAPHAALVVGKRGSGKSYTLGVLAEELAAASGVTGVVVDPMGVFGGLAAGGDADVVTGPRVRAGALDPAAWCDALDVDPTSAAGSLLWRAAAGADTLDGMREAVGNADAADAAVRAARNYLDLADRWDVFDRDGLSAADLLDGPVTVLDCREHDERALNVAVRGVARALYRRAVTAAVDRLPWLLVDEAHACFAGVAGPALRTLLTRGRRPGVSLVCATQRPSALPDVAVSQADVLIAHRLTAGVDLDALARTRPSYLHGELVERLPRRPGEALVVDDAGERACTVRVRERRTPHGGASPRASRAAHR